MDTTLRIGGLVIIAGLTQSAYALWVTGGHPQHIRALLRTFRAEWSAWSAARRVVRVGVAVIGWLGVVGVLTLMTWAGFGIRQWTGVVILAGWSGMTQATVFVSGPYMAQRKRMEPLDVRGPDGPSGKLPGPLGPVQRRR